MRPMNRLSAVRVKGATAPGYYADGGGLYLQVARGGSKSWIFVYNRNGKRHDMGLGGVLAVPLAAARQKAAAARELLAAGKDPLAERRRVQAAEAGVLTFSECAEAYISAHQAGWRNGKHAEQWRATLTTYAYPVVGKLPVNQVDDGHVLRILEPIWTIKTETAKRVRGRIESILDWAKAKKQRAGENPARWKAHLDQMLAAPSKVRRVEHFAALPYSEVGAFVADLQRQGGTAAWALGFVILTACRTGEAIGARWSEIDGDVWTVPGERTKSGREHRVPMSAEALAILTELRKAATGEFVFPGGKRGKPLSNMALAAVLERMEREDITVHGFRSCFRDWCAEQTNFPRELAEAALGHVLKDKTEAAYQRGDLLEKRRRLMQAWAKYCTNPLKSGEIVPIRAS